MSKRRRAASEPTDEELLQELEELRTSPVTRASLNFITLVPSPASVDLSTSHVANQEAAKSVLPEATGADSASSKTNGFETTSVAPTPVEPTPEGVSGLNPATTTDLFGRYLIDYKDYPNQEAITSGVGKTGVIMTPVFPTPDVPTPVAGDSEQTAFEGEIAAEPQDRSRPVHYCTTAQEAHSHLEQLIYQVMWSIGKPVEGTDDNRPRRFQMPQPELARRTNCTEKNLRLAILRLIEKLAIEEEQGFSKATKSARVYKVYSYQEILRRRRAAGLLWVIKDRGIRFVPAPNHKTTPVEPTPVIPKKPAQTTPVSPTRSSQTTPVSPTKTTPVRLTDPTLLQEKEYREAPPAALPAELGQRLRQEVTPTFDEAAASRLWRECRLRAPDCSVDEVLHFTRLKVQQVQRSSDVRNWVGLLLVAVPVYFEGGQLAELRAERDRVAEALRREREEANRYWQQVLDDPRSGADDKELARKFLDL